jgi:hypothetical protein
MGGKIVNDCYYGRERWRYWYLFRVTTEPKKRWEQQSEKNGAEAV